MKRHYQTRILRIAGELLPIVTGVLIAMFVHEWNERRTQAEAFEGTLTRVCTDVKKARFQADQEFAEIRLQQDLRGVYSVAGDDPAPLKPILLES